MKNSNEVIRLCALNQIFSNNYLILNQLLEYVGDSEMIFTLSRRDLEELIPGSNHLYNKISDPNSLEWAKSEVDACYRIGGEIITINDPRYPYRVREIADAPPILYYKGNCNLNSERSVAVVGTRKCSSYGAVECDMIVENLLSDHIKPLIVSGLAYGIDICAHKCSLRHKSPTVAVMATGIDSVYPASHLNYANEIINCGAIISDFPLKSLPYKNNFIKRNRIIAALSDAVILIESPYKGGSINTARFASEFDREIFALPGRRIDYNSIGCNNLIERDIARIFTSTEQFKKRMNWEESTPLERDLFSRNMRPEQLKIVDILRQNNSLLAEEIGMATSLDIGDLSSALVELEMDGIITKGRDDRYILVK